MIYFDNSATTRTEASVLDTYRAVNEQYFGNPSSLHQLGERSRQLLDQSRKQIAELMGVNKEEIVFTSGGTEGDNFAIKGTAMAKKGYGRHMITSITEHPAVLKSMEQLESIGWDVTYLSVDKKGKINLNELKTAIRKDTVLVSLMAVNNETGSLQPLKEVSEVLEDHPSIHFHVDAVQALGKVDLDLNESRIDMAVFSGHKFHAPKGTGFMYVRKGRKLSPLLSGGGQESGLRNGTENVPGNVALAKALRLLLKNKKATNDRLSSMKQSLLNYFSELEKVTVFSPEESAPHIISFGIKNSRGEVLVHALEKEGIYISTTSACSSRKNKSVHSIKEMGHSKEQAASAVRISLSNMNTKDEVEIFKKTFNKVYERLKAIE
ncbi:cysteine desulfurase family protein [Alkalibacterium kapii]|uniref:Aminotransferase V n=1 Tax=Alkalibacterium kapii TaxID=426704 RepID=A0A511AWR2_9LACT|nr:cysteine desulfurase family protein [Alkalibacterium kapii]GEK91551.1 aminotransferase V [Alkalibacterium kapii]